RPPLSFPTRRSSDLSAPSTAWWAPVSFPAGLGRASPQPISAKRGVRDSRNVCLLRDFQHESIRRPPERIDCFPSVLKGVRLDLSDRKSTRLNSSHRT